MVGMTADRGRTSGSTKRTGFNISQTPFGAAQPTSPVAAMGTSSPGYGVLKSSPAAGTRRAPAPAPAPAPRVQDPNGGTNYGGGGGGGMVTPFGTSLAPQVAAPSEEDYLSGDSGYQTQLSALQSALERYLADSDFQRTNYNADYGKSLRDLGYDETSKAWNWNDPLTASGNAYQHQLDDFGARNMLQSSGYADAFNQLQRMLGQQYDSLSGAKNTFMSDLDRQGANYKAENTANQQAARAEALQRRAAQFAL